MFVLSQLTFVGLFRLVVRFTRPSNFNTLFTTPNDVRRCRYGRSRTRTYEPFGVDLQSTAIATMRFSLNIASDLLVTVMLSAQHNRYLIPVPSLTFFRYIYCESLESNQRLWLMRPSRYRFSTPL